MKMQAGTRERAEHIAGLSRY